jgi:hypothetical protein
MIPSAAGFLERRLRGGGRPALATLAADAELARARQKAESRHRRAVRDMDQLSSLAEAATGRC